MASMAATCRFTIKGFESRSLCPRSSSLHPQFHSLSTYRRSTTTDSLRISKNVGLLRVRAMCSDSSGPGSQLEDTVNNTIAQNPVVVYSKTWCSYSSEVKSLFKRLGAEPFVIELDRLGAQGSQLQKTLEKLTGQHTVPNVFIGGKHIGGCSDTIKLYQEGELESLLSEAGATKENNAKNAQVARLSREEFLSNLKLRVDERRILPLSAFRGIARLVILARPASFIQDSFKLSEPFSDSLLKRGILVVPFVTDGGSPKFEFEEKEETKDINAKRKRLWQLAPVYAAEWSKWLDEQKKLAKVFPESPVYLSLRMDGRVRGSGVGYPPWNAFVTQLPPVKGIWTGLLDGMDGRV